MLLDNELVFSSAQAVTASAASTNLYDFGSAGVDVGTGESLYLVISVVTAALNDSSGTDATVTPSIETDDNAAFSSATTAATLPAFSHADAVGTQKIYRLNPGEIAERYMRIFYTVASGPLDAGAFDAFIVKDVHKWVAKANAVGASLPHEA